MPIFDVAMTMRVNRNVQIDAASADAAQRIANEMFAAGTFADKAGWDLYDAGKSGWATAEARAVCDFQVGWIEPRPDPVSAAPSRYNW